MSVIPGWERRLQPHPTPRRKPRSPSASESAASAAAWAGRWQFLLALLLLIPTASAAPDPPPDAFDFRLSDRLADLQIEDGMIVTETPQGPRRVEAEAFLRAVEARQRAGERRGPLFQLFDITGPLGLIWIAIGFLGQFLFAGRMLVQWLASEKHRRSVVPTAFWWMSLLGASMLLSYFIWRQDIVGVFGQATGWLIYARNLWLIHRGPRATLSR